LDLNLCPECKATLPAGTLVCPTCGEKDFLRGRTAGGRVSGAPVEARPYFAAPPPKRTIPTWVWVALSISALLVGCLGLAGWAGYKGWMRGPGGDIAFNQHNQAGNRAFGEHDFARANEEYSQMIALRPRLMAGYLLRGMALHSLGRYHEAIQDDTTALALSDGKRDAADLYSNRANADTRAELLRPLPSA
jgi:tetratricopeptide (TPR) repeat protein